MIPEVVLGTFLKLLLYPAYHSTDFDVHRNWLAITHGVPLREWYYEATSQWTLDYPPFFAYFEWLIGWFAPKSVIEDGCFNILPTGNYGWPTVVFQRTTVVITELLLSAALYAFVKTRGEESWGLGYKQRKAVAAIIWLHPGWLILDHIHFQYNGFLFGIFVFSLVAGSRGHYLWCAATFATLLCFKHIFLYVAPAYFAWLLRGYILQNGQIHFMRAIKLGLATLSPIIVAIAPFINDWEQLVTRLFPFSRGLTHAYWAPNIWALYSFADKVIGLIRGNSVGGGSRGIVGDVAFSNLPQLTPFACFVISAALQFCSIIPVLLKPSFTRFLATITSCAFASFLFGWHVHEKAIMLVVVPFAFLSLVNRRLLVAFYPLLWVSCVSLFPLIWTHEETIIKYVYTACYLLVCQVTLRELAPVVPRTWYFDRFMTLYCLGYIIVLPFSALPLGNYEFAGLMLLSLYSAVGVVASWIGFSWIFFMTL